MTTHVFIVDDDTLPVHLKYLFAGTGFKDFDIDLNNPEGISLKQIQEKTILGLLADIKRVRNGDKVIFYLTQTSNREGMFFGIFKIKDNSSIVFHEPNGTYLKDILKKQLIFRTLIEPEEVFPKGVTEWEALDDITEISNPKELMWSLIYRKLKGNRGCTAITDEESDRLIELIKNKNNNNPIKKTDNLIFDKSSQIIKGDTSPKAIYDPSKTQGNLNILPLMSLRYSQERSHEVHLQAYITENAGKNDATLNNIVGSNDQIVWFGNEVSCGVGMQRIDIFPILKIDSRKEFRVLELKCVYAFKDPRLIKQLKRYLEWTKLFISGADIKKIQPMVLAKKIPDFCRSKFRKFEKEEKKDYSEIFQTLIDSFKKFNSENGSKPIRFFEYEIVNGQILFEEVNY